MAAKDQSSAPAAGGPRRGTAKAKRSRSSAAVARGSGAGPSARQERDDTEEETVPLTEYQALQRQNKALSRALDKSHEKIIYLEKQISGSPYAVEVRKTLSRKKYRYGELPAAGDAPSQSGSAPQSVASPAQQSQLRQSGTVRTIQDRRATEEQASQIQTLQMINSELKKIIKKKDAELEEAYAMLDDSKRASQMRSMKRDLQFYKSLCEENGLIGEANGQQAQLSLRTDTGIVVKGNTGGRSQAKSPTQGAKEEDDEDWDAGYTDALPVADSVEPGTDVPDTDVAITATQRTEGRMGPPGQGLPEHGRDGKIGEDFDESYHEERSGTPPRAGHRTSHAEGRVGPSGVLFNAGEEQVGQREDPLDSRSRGVIEEYGDYIDGEAVSSHGRGLAERNDANEGNPTYSADHDMDEERFDELSGSDRPSATGDPEAGGPERSRQSGSARSRTSDHFSGYHSAARPVDMLQSIQPSQPSRPPQPPQQPGSPQSGGSKERDDGGFDSETGESPGESSPDLELDLAGDRAGDAGGADEARGMYASKRESRGSGASRLSGSFQGQGRSEQGPVQGTLLNSAGPADLAGSGRASQGSAFEGTETLGLARPDEGEDAYRQSQGDRSTDDGGERESQGGGKATAFLIDYGGDFEGSNGSHHTDPAATAELLPDDEEEGGAGGPRGNALPPGGSLSFSSDGEAREGPTGALGVSGDQEADLPEAFTSSAYNHSGRRSAGFASPGDASSRGDAGSRGDATLDPEGGQELSNHPRYEEADPQQRLSGSSGPPEAGGNRFPAQDDVTNEFDDLAF